MSRRSGRSRSNSRSRSGRAKCCSNKLIFMLLGAVIIGAIVAFIIYISLPSECYFRPGPANIRNSTINGTALFQAHIRRVNKETKETEYLPIVATGISEIDKKDIMRDGVKLHLTCGYLYRNVSSIYLSYRKSGLDEENRCKLMPLLNEKIIDVYSDGKKFKFNYIEPVTLKCATEDGNSVAVFEKAAFKKM